MQNSGLGTSLNALASLALMYGLPSLLLVTWRGHRGKDAPEHLLTGEISPRLLELLGGVTQVGRDGDDRGAGAQSRDQASDREGPASHGAGREPQRRGIRKVQ
jgi:hypothetical protein